MKSTRVGVKRFFFFFEEPEANKQPSNNLWKAHLISSLVGFKKKKVMERKKFDDEICEDIIWSLQEFEDDDISEQYDCLITFWIT